MDQQTFEKWQVLCPQGMEQMMQGEISAGSVFLFSSVTAPLPCGGQYEFWQWFDSASELIEYLRCVGLPDMYDLWFDRPRSNGGASKGRWDAHAILSLAQSRHVYERDVPLARELIERVETAPDDRDLQLALIEQVLVDFNRRFGLTRTWDLNLFLFPTVLQAGRMLHDTVWLEDESGERISAEQWRELCSLVPTDPASAALVAHEFRKADGL